MNTCMHIWNPHLIFPIKRHYCKTTQTILASFIHQTILIIEIPGVQVGDSKTLHRLEKIKSVCEPIKISKQYQNDTKPQTQPRKHVSKSRYALNSYTSKETPVINVVHETTNFIEAQIVHILRVFCMGGDFHIMRNCIYRSYKYVFYIGLQFR